MTAYELIKERRSIRTFEKAPLSEEYKDLLTEYAKNASNPYGLDIEWFLIPEGGKLSSKVITGADTFIAGKMKKAPHAEEAFGYSFEKIVIYAMSLGVGTTWIAGTMDRKAFEEAVNLSDGEVMPCISPLGIPSKEMSLREKLMRTSVKADSRLDSSDLFFDCSFDRPLITEDSKLLKILEGVRRAPSAVNKQPWRIVKTDNSFCFFEKKSKGYDSGEWDLQKVDMGIALCHFEMLAKEEGFKTEFDITDPVIPLPEKTEYIATYRITE